jgi:hypothetical protein
MDILEQVAFEKFSASKVTLDTSAYLLDMIPEGTWYLEDKTKIGKSVRWYEARGFKEYRVRQSVSMRHVHLAHI